MVDVRPFLGIRYNSQLLEENLHTVMAPPYDTINEELQTELYRRSPYNVIRLILGKEKISDDEYNNKYVRSANYFQTWRRDGILVEDEQESFYIYKQIFTAPDGELHQRIGWIGLIKLEELEKGRVRAHENTFKGPIADRLKLLRTSKCNFSPLFTFYDKQSDKIQQVYEKETRTKPWQEITDDDGVIHQLWVVSKKTVIRYFTEEMKQKGLYIADGHHRYETALQYRDEMRESTHKKDGKQPFDYVMMYITSALEDNLLILPTHRVLSREFGSDVHLREVLDDLNEYFEVEKFQVPMHDPEQVQKSIQDKMSISGDDPMRFCMLLPDGNAFCLTVRRDLNLKEVFEADIPSEIRALDVTVLHHLVITQSWIGNPDIEFEAGDIFYVKDAIPAVKILTTENGCVAFFLNPTRMDQFKKIVAKGLRMPHKSTYFYPKLLSGLVMRDLTSRLI